MVHIRMYAYKNVLSWRRSSEPQMYPRKGSKFNKLSEVWRCLNILKEVDSSIDWHGYDCLTLQYTSNEFLKKYES